MSGSIALGHVLDQDRVWMTKDGRELPISNMSQEHRLNTLLYLYENAERTVDRYLRRTHRNPFWSTRLPDELLDTLPREEERMLADPYAAVRQFKLVRALSTACELTVIRTRSRDNSERCVAALRDAAGPYTNRRGTRFFVVVPHAELAAAVKFGPEHTSPDVRGLRAVDGVEYPWWAPRGSAEAQAA